MPALFNGLGGSSFSYSVSNQGQLARLRNLKSSISPSPKQMIASADFSNEISLTQPLIGSGYSRQELNLDHKLQLRSQLVEVMMQEANVTSSSRSGLAERSVPRKPAPPAAHLHPEGSSHHAERLFVVIADDLGAATANGASVPPSTHQAYQQHPAVDETLIPSPVERALKRVLDIVGTLLLIVVFSPFIIPIALFIRMSGPVIYKHRRVGKNGRPFDCLKFRTMVPNADRYLADVLEKDPELKAEWIRDHKLRDDPRITTLGKFLRRTSLDELPQLWNVLRGEMSLVGPRPVVKEELLRYGRSVVVYYAAKPGLTGLWQVSGRNELDYRRRVAIDVYYVRNRNLLLDVYILLKTTKVVLAGKGAY
jgi:lipopolysaccharide/colanic/teichoic acid biosynthesis glycosyltransferase